jgi:hypothetical protein
MNAEFKQEIRFGIESLDKVFASIMAIAAQDIPQSVKSPALAFECLGYYNALEHMMLRFIKELLCEASSKTYLRRITHSNRFNTIVI